MDWRKEKIGASTTKRRTKLDPWVERLLRLILEAGWAKRAEALKIG
jgi:hypothetical protein